MMSAHQSVAVQFHLRPARAEDESFRYRLFVETAAEEFMAIVGDANLLQMQYRARETNYAAIFPAAEEKIICLADGSPAGRLLVCEQPGRMRLIDIGLLKSQRGQGVGSAVVWSLQQECEAKGLPLELQVRQASPAARLYSRLGFTVTSQDAMYVQMTWQPTQQAARALYTAVNDAGLVYKRGEK